MNQKKLEIVAVGAHPDDIEFGAAGTLKLLAEQGHDIHFVTMTPGDLGSPEVFGDDIAATRFREARESARLLDGTYDCIGAEDLQVKHSQELVKEVVRVLRKYEVNLLFTHPPRDYMKDHEGTHEIVRDAANRLPVPRYQRVQVKSGNFPPKIDSIPPLYYWAPYGGLNYAGKVFPAHFLISLAEEEIDHKKNALKCHESQREWLRQHYGTDEYVENMLEISKKWIKQFDLEEDISRAHAEPFIQDLSAGFPQENLLGELLEDRLISSGEHKPATRHGRDENLFIE
ncbi:MAG: PIG-L deacetylase family protein [Candidatus Bipolaricaulota bacterium]|nr:PIG-L family deacetylase [Candidatus Bipolaricaulota bacterium]